MDAPSVDLQLQQALSQGDLRRAGQLLVVHHADAVYATCRAMVRDGVLAEDLSQEAFTKALAALGSFRGESQSRTWLLSITRNVCLDHLRRTRGPIDERAELDPEVEPSETPPPFDLLVRRGDVERSLSVLGETERAIVVLHHAHGVGYLELAGSFGIAEGTLRMRMSRALLKMRQALDEAEQTPVPTLGRPMLPPVPRAASVPTSSRARLSTPGAPPPAELDEKSAAAPTPARAEAPRSEGFLGRVRRAFGGVPAAPTPSKGGGSGAPVPALWAMPASLRERLLASV